MKKLLCFCPLIISVVGVVLMIVGWNTKIFLYFTLGGAMIFFGIVATAIASFMVFSGPAQMLKRNFGVNGKIFETMAKNIDTIKNGEEHTCPYCGTKFRKETKCPSCGAAWKEE